MINRNLEIKVRFTRDELQALDKKVKKTGLSCEGYVRTLCKNKVPVEIPPADYYALIREVRTLGNNLHQLVRLQGLLDAPEFRCHADRLTAVADQLTIACLPRDGDH